MVVAVIPAYNEAATIGRVVRDLLGQGVERCVVVDDGSADATAPAAHAAGATVITHLINRGQGAALQTGNEYAVAIGATAVVHFDADGQLTAADVPGAIERLIKANLDVVLGSRFLDNRSQIPWTKKYIVLPVARLINRFLTGLKLTDVHNGFRVLSLRALRQVSITHDGMAHNTEIIREIKRQGLTWAEYPVEVIYHEYGQGIGGGFKIIWDLIFKGVSNK